VVLEWSTRYGLFLIASQMINFTYFPCWSKRILYN
jgi:hypothetical protein